ncbi:hypothetical protein BS78_10G255600 [Paspalum vaginatum]|nr:hypothetical protein BS78_10G255600 [Paspalum vaginatum]
MANPAAAILLPLLAFLLLLFAITAVANPPRLRRPLPLQPPPLPPSLSAPPAPPSGRPTSCLGPLSNLQPCATFLTNNTYAAPPPTSCCIPLRSVLQGPADICACHALNGGLDGFLGGRVNLLRLALLPVFCGAAVRPQLGISCLVEPIPPIQI